VIHRSDAVPPGQRPPSRELDALPRRQRNPRPVKTPLIGVSFRRSKRPRQRMATWIDPDRRCLELRLARAEVRRSADEPIDRTGRGSHSLAPVPPRRRREGFGRLSRAASSSATWCSPCCAKSTARGCTLRATSSFNSKDLRCCEDKCEDVFEFLEHGGRRARRSRRSKRVLRSENENRAMLGRVALRFPTSPSRRLPHEPRRCRARGWEPPWRKPAPVRAPPAARATPWIEAWTATPAARRRRRRALPAARARQQAKTRPARPAARPVAAPALTRARP
jgi:hypothetical protein